MFMSYSLEENIFAGGKMGWWYYSAMEHGDHKYKVLLIDDPRHTEKLGSETEFHVLKIYIQQYDV